MQLLAHVHALLGNADAAVDVPGGVRALPLGPGPGAVGSRDVPCGGGERGGGEQERGETIVGTTRGPAN